MCCMTIFLKIPSVEYAAEPWIQYRSNVDRALALHDIPSSSAMRFVDLWLMIMFPIIWPILTALHAMPGPLLWVTANLK